jgi:hypothetical protein
MKTTKTIAMLCLALLAATGTAYAQDRTRDQVRDQLHAADKTRDRDMTRDRDQTKDMTKDRDQTKARDRDRIFGEQLMTEQERNEFRNRIRLAKSDGERAQIRNEHRKQMLERAKQRGVTLSE